VRKKSLLFWLLVAVWIAACTPVDKPHIGTVVMLPSPAHGGVDGPRLVEGADRELTLSWMESRESGTDLKFASFHEGGFEVANTVVTEPRMFVNWADLPSVMRVRDDHWIAHWLRYSADLTYSYDVVVSQSFDGGNSWGDPVSAHSDGTPTEHGFVSMHANNEGVALLWLDGRDTANPPGEHILDTSMTLRSAVITTDGERISEQLVDDSVCDCCQTDVAIASTGPIAVYRDRSADEIRDIYITRYIDDHWEPGIPLHADDWKIAGCPVNGPAIVARDEHVAVAWFTAANNKPTMRVVISEDAGTTFGEPIEVASGRITGHAGLALMDDDSLAVSWVSRNKSGSNSINLRRHGTDGKLGPVHVVGETNQLRVFPQIAYRDNHLILVWTDESDDQRQLRVARVPVQQR